MLLSKGDLVTLGNLLEDMLSGQQHFNRFVKKDMFLGIVTRIYEQHAEVRWIRHPTMKERLATVHCKVLTRVVDD
mgnify:CR=1 FL=1